MTSESPGSATLRMSHDNQNMAVLGMGRQWSESCPTCHLVGLCRAPFSNQFSFMFSSMTPIKIWNFYEVDLWMMLNWEKHGLP